jgi:hypothetical protein
MKPVTFVILFGAAGVLTACSGLQNLGLGKPKPGQSVEFIAGNPSSVLIDYDTSPPGELQYATSMAIEKCKIFDRSTAVLAGLNTRDDGRMRAEYTCK